MAGAFSGHLLNAFNSAGSAQSSTPTIVTSGAMSFDARAHGTPAPSFPPFFSPSPMPHAPFGFTPLTEDSTTAKHIATLQAKLNKKLGPEYVSQRPGPGGGPKLTYAEGWKIINLANEVFGFNGWSSNIVSVATDFVDYSEESKRFNVGVTAIVRVTLRDGAYHEDVGYGLLENAKSKAGALDKCKKEAITDALKRTLRNFGNLLGNCLYDKSYAQEVVKIKAKLDKNELYRRPEFEERTPDAPASRDQVAIPEASSSNREEPRIKVEGESHQPETPITYVPRHLRQEMAAAAQQAQAPARAPTTPPHRVPTHPSTHASTSGSGMTRASANYGPPPVEAPKHSGLATPIQTPAQPPRPPPPRAFPPRGIATSPLARIRSAPERSVSSTESMPARAGSADTADLDMDDAVQGNGGGRDEDEDAFPLSTQDDAFLATVDLGEGDLGRPIDFEEGIGGVSMVDASALELEPDSAEQSPAVPPRPQPQARDRAGSGTSAGSPSGGAPQTNVRTQSAVKPSLSASGNASPNADPASGGQPRPQVRSGPPSTAPTSSASSMRVGPSAQDVKRPRPTMTSAGGSHFPPGTKPPTQQQQPQQHTPKPVMSSSVRTTSNTPQTGPGPGPGPTNALKRSVDVMQAASGSSTRPPIQGVSLAQRQQQQHHQQNAIARRPSDNGEGNDPKRLKR